MFEKGAEEPTSGPEPDLGDLVRHWSGDSRFGLRLSAPDAVWLVLDGTAERVLLASTAADGLGRAIGTDESGRVDAIRLCDQVRPRRLPLDRPTLMKLRFETRRLGAATTCLVLRTKDKSGRNLLIVALLDRLPNHRASPQKAIVEPALPQAEEAPEPAGLSPVAEGVPSPQDTPSMQTGRLVWRSDADDRLTDISGAAAASVKPAMLGRTWSALSQTRTLLDAEGLLLALAQRRTFRAISVTLQPDGAPDAMDLDISGTPTRRAGDEFSGFNGFAMVRPSVSPSAQDVVASTDDAEASPDQSPSERPVPEAAGGIGTVSDPAEVTAPVTSLSKSTGSPVSSGVPAIDAAALPPVAEPSPFLIADAASPVVEADAPPAPPPLVSESDAPPEQVEFATEPSSDAQSGWSTLQDSHLSSHEHAAFREIARALGARFAGDSESDDEVTTDDERPASGSVTPFPSAMARNVEPAPEGPNAAVAATLERLPGGVMIYRDDSVLFANGRLLTMAGFADLAELTASGGLDRLFGGLIPHERSADGAPALLTTRTGDRLSVDIQASEVDWTGAPAQLLLVRDAVAGEPARERAAMQIADAFAGARAADAQAVLDSLEDGVVTLDRNARIIGLNRSAAATFGLDPREVVGAGILSLFAPESAVAVLASVHGIAGPAQAAQSQPVPDVIARAAAGMLPMLIHVAPLAGRDDGRMVMTVRDVRATRSVEAESSNARRAAEYASARKSDFLARISHEIRTPMNGILGFADMMLAEPFGPIGHERYRDYLGDIHASGTHVLSLVNDLLDLAKIEAGRLDLTFEEVPLNDVVTHCVAMLQPQAMRDRIVLRTSFSHDLPPLVADERSLRQAALNIIANAIAFTEAGGQVIVSTTLADRGEIALRVRDTGIGMSPDEVETALEPFRQIAVAASPKGRADGRSTGTGLGLPLTKALVEANHGSFRIESRKDEGTLVEMLFPPQAAVRTA
ncbi:Cell-division control histidine kinase PdhS [Methylobacterium bullatum]|uniref:histidine kinase n=1 Tax=Methylobacterium bullatum TaxID=570505 RepID=A0AAV4ZAZ4_9HYPH|nr:PAS domain-containing sensor histidine kinase [Methylobacterium bullatum]GJD41101.1 Cell-division control histidine kinase PdhS [Methylobacterium bullatum]